MAKSLKQLGLRMINGEDQSLLGDAGRIGTSIVEPFYSLAMTVRNACYDRGIFATHDLGRRTISVGNITTGGTGKTPVVRWLCEQLKKRSRHPAILLRGYGGGTFSDEAQLLKDSLIQVPVQANPSRTTGAAQVLKDHPDVDVFVLDDAFQHRKVRRDFNLVLISATQPFGFGHVLPRGLLRESLRGLARADAFLITRSSLVLVERLLEIERFLSEHHPSVPVFHSDHRISKIWMPVTDEESALKSYEVERVFLTAGIGDPAAFAKLIAGFGCHVVGTYWVADHHVLTKREIILIGKQAQEANADIVLTTEKDWVKMKLQMPQASDLSVGVVKLELGFRNGDEERLLELISKKISPDADG
jgi:tetraacyldisaccharide 4'-kinase